MTLHVRTFCDATFIVVESDLDFTSASELRTEIFSAGAKSAYVVVSLDDCDYCDLTGVRTLVEAKRWFRERVEIVIPAGHVARRLIAILGFDGTVRARATFGEAIVSLVGSDDA